MELCIENFHVVEGFEVQMLDAVQIAEIWNGVGVASRIRY